MPDATVRIPAEVKERLTAAATGEGLSLRAYLVRLAGTPPTPQERAEQALRAQAALHQWLGPAPSPEERERLDEELDRRLARAADRSA
ncbi:hypothetical protein [Streptomyces chrestomyceticus]|uniref:hypothetical protein n=1 Tax=Streptomyces chrestomyceticus TaxID=68185 RepID=UPI0037ACE70B